jgi:hypothetical protein
MELRVLESRIEFQLLTAIVPAAGRNCVARAAGMITRGGPPRMQRRLGFGSGRTPACSDLVVGVGVEGRNRAVNLSRETELLAHLGSAGSAGSDLAGIARRLPLRTQPPLDCN